jgi:hypothetical protein
MDSEFLKNVGWVILDWAKQHLTLSSLLAGFLVALLVYIVVPRLPDKPSENPTDPVPTIQQQSGPKSPCSNNVAIGRGKVNCSSNEEVSPDAQHPATP